MMLHELHVATRHADALIQLAALPSAASAGRRFIRTVLQIQSVSEFEDAALLCTSELVTNAINAEMADELVDGAQVPLCGIVVLCAEITEHHLRIEVWDTSAELPAPRRAGEDEEHGRGLTLVSAACDRWGWELLAGSHARGPCKVTWCEWDRLLPDSDHVRPLDAPNSLPVPDRQTASDDMYPARHAG